MGEKEMKGDMNEKIKDSETIQKEDNEEEEQGGIANGVEKERLTGYRIEIIKINDRKTEGHQDKDERCYDKDD